MSWFVRAVLQVANVPCRIDGKAVTVHLDSGTPRTLRQAIGLDESFAGRFDLPLPDGEIYLGRTSPVVEGLAGWTLDQALDPESRDVGAAASRCGVISTSAVAARATLLVARLRYHLRSGAHNGDAILCEEVAPLACTGPAEAPRWLTPEEGERLLAARPERNLLASAFGQQIDALLSTLPRLQAALETVAHERAAAQLDVHRRVRDGSRGRGRIAIEPVLPVDILGAYVLLPMLS